MPLKPLPPRLSKGKVWCIEFYSKHPDTDEDIRFRKTFNLNRIKDLIAREKYAIELIQLLNQKIKQGYPFLITDLDGPSASISIFDALKIAVDIKSASDRDNSSKSYRSISKIFLQWCDKNNFSKLSLASFSQQHVYKFLDYLSINRKVGHRTYNNYLMFLKTMFNELIKRSYISKNVWAGIPKKKEQGKLRSIIPDHEKKIIFEYITKHEPVFALGVVLTYHCFIRPAELRRLKFNMFNLREGIIVLPGSITKNRDTSILTIPKTILEFLESYKIDERPGHFYLFGMGGCIGSRTQISRDYFNKIFQKVLKEMYSQKIIKRINGATFYSWKDTGVTTLIKNNVDIHQIMKQLRHTDMAVTQKYIQSVSNINQSIRDLKTDLL